MLVLFILFPVLSIKEIWREHKGVPPSSDEQMNCDLEFQHQAERKASILLQSEIILISCNSIFLGMWKTVAFIT